LSLYSGLSGLGGLGALGAYSGLGGLSLYSGLGGLGSLGSLYGLGGLGAYSGLGGYSPFSLSNLYYPVQTTAAGLSYQIPYLQLAPLLGVSGLYSQLFPYLFNTTLTGTDTTQ
jgi:hypothetical protein